MTSYRIDILQDDYFLLRFETNNRIGSLKDEYLFTETSYKIITFFRIITLLMRQSTEQTSNRLPILLIQATPYRIITLLLRQTTGHMEQPKVQQQHIQPQKSHLMLTGNAFFSMLFSRHIVALYSSGATCNSHDNSSGKRTLFITLFFRLLWQCCNALYKRFKI
jgi:hypothetical protein